MEEDAQRMLALKKAYADIILNTAKEAAARVLVSERKVHRFQQDLFSTKDEALSMLLRLKQMMDSKMNEAEKTSMSQQRRIVELEEQLNEAEQIIVDLRAELNQVQDVLEKMRKKQVWPLNGQISLEDVHSHENKLITSEPLSSSPSDSGPQVITTADMTSAPLDARILDNGCCNAKMTLIEESSGPHLENDNPDNPNFTCKMVRSENAEQDRNGCTQRTCAFEEDSLDGELLPVDDGPCSLDEIEVKCSIPPSPRAECIDIMEKPTGSEEATQLNISMYKKPVRVIRRRKRKIRYGNKKNSCKSHPHLLPKSSQPASLFSYCKASSNLVNNNVKPVGVCTVTPKTDNMDITKSSGPEAILRPVKVQTVPTLKVDNMDKMKSSNRSNQLEEIVRPGGACIIPSPKVDNMDIMKSSNGLEEILRHYNDSDEDEDEDKDVEVTPRGFKEREVKNSSTIVATLRSTPRQLNKICPSSSLLSCCRASSSVNGNIKSDEGALEMTENKTKIKSIRDLGPAVKPLKVIENFMDKDAELIDIPVALQHEGGSVNCSGASLMYSNPKKAVSFEANNRVPTQAEGDRLLKYTFTRKRKKESLSLPVEEISLEKCSLKRRAGEKQSDASEPQKSCLMDGPPRDSRQLVQLVSLSGKKWW